MTEKELRVAFNSYIRDYGKMIGRSTRDIRQTILLHFTQGVAACDKYWQEKTRWIPIKEKLPEVREKPYYICIKLYNDSFGFLSCRDTVLIKKTEDIDWVKNNTTFWKEID